MTYSKYILLTNNLKNYNHNRYYRGLSERNRTNNIFKMEYATVEIVFNIISSINAKLQFKTSLYVVIVIHEVSPLVVD